MRIAQQLHLDVARPIEQPLEIDAVVAERRQRLRARQANRALELVRSAHDPHPFPAPAGHGLHQQRISNAVGCIPPWNDRHARRNRDIARARLAAHRPHRRRVGPDERESGLDARLGELGVLGQKSVAGMHRVGARRSGHVDQLVDPQVAFRCLVRPDGVRFVGQAHVKRVAVAF